MYSIDLNSDMGESFGAYKLGGDEEIIKYVTTANVACENVRFAEVLPESDYRLDGKKNILLLWLAVNVVLPYLATLK